MRTGLPGNEVMVPVEVPGVRKEDIEVSVSGNMPSNPGQPVPQR
jgi:hypothetical protein